MNKPENYSRDADMLKALGHPVRLCIAVNLLRQKGSNVGAMVKCIGVAQPTISQHLNILRAAGVVSCTRHANRMLYSLASRRAEKIVRALL
jgi:ArsR family transcriptional regulator